ncbi:SpoIIE family protein phosphatase [Streptomyces olivaceoviridis]|uniref:SpoIIE family protein phosphatase n=1 Tax=Streptomyces olivaceoviridis TaxID=1921 RepID=UPI0036FE40B2
MLIVLITVADTVTPAEIVLGPLLVIAPALTAWFEGPWTTGGIGVLAVAAQTSIGRRSGLLTSRGVIVQIVALSVLVTLIVVMCVVRDRRSRQLTQVRSGPEAVQRVLLWPLPNHLGSLRLACLYLAAEDEAEIGGDLYATARTEGAVRLMIGDVRGKGLPAIGEAAVVLGAIREAAHQHTGLPELAGPLEEAWLGTSPTSSRWTKPGSVSSRPCCWRFPMTTTSSVDQLRPSGAAPARCGRHRDRPGPASRTSTRHRPDGHRRSPG